VQIDIDILSTEQLAGLVSRLSAELTARLLTASPSPAGPPAPEWALTAAEAARKLGKSRRWLFEHAAELPFIRRVSRKTLVADEAGLKRWIASRPR